MPETVTDVLRKARELYAQAPSHIAFCLATAIYAASDGKPLSGQPALHAMEGIIGTRRFATWNAANCTETVLAAFDAAIEAGS